MENIHQYISIILPTLNEVDNITSIIRKIITLSDNFIELSYDDASTDGTTALVKKLSQEDNRIRLINRYGRMGYLALSKRAAFRLQEI